MPKPALPTEAETLTEFAANPRWLGGTPGFTLVLHTWQQDLGRHIHLHALVAGGALSAQGDWLSTKRGFLFPVLAMSKVYRGKFLAALESARQAGGLRHDVARREGAWRDIKAALYGQDWVAYAKQPLGGPAQVLAYLGRYTHRVAISNERILDAEGGLVRFRVRDRDGKGKKVRCLEAGEFIRRFLLHVLPAGFKRIRHYGLLGWRTKRESGGSTSGVERGAAGGENDGVSGRLHAPRGGNRVVALSALRQGAVHRGGGDASQVGTPPSWAGAP